MARGQCLDNNERTYKREWQQRYIGMQFRMLIWLSCGERLIEPFVENEWYKNDACAWGVDLRDIDYGL